MDNEDLCRLRAKLLDQLRYLLDEVVAMEPVLDRLHEAELGIRERGPSVKECYGALIAWDRGRLIPELNRLNGTVTGQEECVEPDWNALPLRKILGEVNKVRSVVVDQVAALNAARWTGRISLGDEAYDVYGLVHRTIQHDVRMLRTIAECLHQGW